MCEICFKYVILCFKELKWVMCVYWDFFELIMLIFEVDSLLVEYCKIMDEIFYWMLDESCYLCVVVEVV